MQVFASLPNILAPLPDAPLALRSVSELYLAAFGRAALFAEKSNNDSRVGLNPLNEKPETDEPHDNNSKHTAVVMPP
jgi:hypothetical protein